MEERENTILDQDRTQASNSKPLIQDSQHSQQSAGQSIDNPKLTAEKRETSGSSSILNKKINMKKFIIAIFFLFIAFAQFSLASVFLIFSGIIENRLGLNIIMIMIGVVGPLNGAYLLYRKFGNPEKPFSKLLVITGFSLLFLPSIIIMSYLLLAAIMYPGGRFGSMN